MRRLRVKRSREFYPHHTLLSAADTNLELAEKKEPGWHYFEMAAILFSGLAVEALANAFGERYVANWGDYGSARPIAKLQIVSKSLGVVFDEQKAPWCHVRWLIKFRNGLAHAKPEMVKVDKEMTEVEWNADRMNVPNSKIETEITLRNAKRAVEAAYLIRDLFCERIPDEDFKTTYAPTVGRARRLR